jgi:hypothetical protein
METKVEKTSKLLFIVSSFGESRRQVITVPGGGLYLTRQYPQGFWQSHLKVVKSTPAIILRTLE